MSVLLNIDADLARENHYELGVTRDPPDEPLAQDLVTDVVVVGGGFAGLSAAIELAQRGLRVVLLEAGRLCGAASGRNGGQAIVGYACGQGLLERQIGIAGARAAWDMSLEGLRLIDERIARHGIACERSHGYLYVAESPRKARRLQAEMLALRRGYGLEVEWAMGPQVRQHIDSPRYSASAYERVSGHLHPLKYGLGLARAARKLGVRIFERSAVTQLVRGPRVVARTASGSVTADFGVLAGNCTLAEWGPGVAPELVPRIMPVGTYIAATDPLPEALRQRLIPSGAAVCDNNFVLDYFRFDAQGCLLFGGRVSYSTRTPARLRERMAARMAQVFPELAGVPLRRLWGGFVDISMNRAPDFGRLDANLYHVQGFSGHGVALTGLAGCLVAEAVTAQADRFDVLARIRHLDFPGGVRWRTPVLALGMAWYRLRDALG
ncbi:MAG: FAD-binding oxidoreductase [Rhodoferax sp.]|nr:FAD-binding oxidoreductase [Rhodoferax sp.]